jgi:predicted short-subunit dehydrogenase-like oxidoreductase (DUF2520 family)
MDWIYSDPAVVNVVGVGKVSSSIARQLKGKVRFGYVVSRNFEKARVLAQEIGGIAVTYEDNFKLNGILLIGVSDSILPTIPLLLNAKVEEGKTIAIHFSGFQLSEILPDKWFPVSMHPNCAVPDEYHIFENVVFGIEGSEVGLEVAKKLIRLLGGDYITIPTDRKMEYHLAAVIISNFPIALAYLSQTIYKDLGFSEELSRRILSTLLNSVSINISSKTLAQALTGPVKRGDWNVVNAEREAFKEKFPEYALVYDALVDIIKKLA